jgi:hydrogenase-4 component F
MTFNALAGVLGIPAIAAALFAYRIGARSNIAATGLTLLCSTSLFLAKPQPGAYLLVDDLNGTFVVLSCLTAETVVVSRFPG